MSKEPSSARKSLGDFAPKLVELTDGVLFGDAWERRELSKRDRSLVTVSALVAMNRPDQLRFHLGRALENGLTPSGILLGMALRDDRHDDREGAVLGAVAMRAGRQPSESSVLSLTKPPPTSG